MFVVRHGDLFTVQPAPSQMLQPDPQSVSQVTTVSSMKRAHFRSVGRESRDRRVAWDWQGALGRHRRDLGSGPSG